MATSQLKEFSFRRIWRKILYKREFVPQNLQLSAALPTSFYRVYRVHKISICISLSCAAKVNEKFSIALSTLQRRLNPPFAAESKILYTRYDLFKNLHNKHQSHFHFQTQGQAAFQSLKVNYNQRGTRAYLLMDCRISHYSTTSYLQRK